MEQSEITAFKLWRPARGDLQAVEAAPGDADHADRTGAPGLRGDPGQHLQRVVLLLLQILALEHAFGIAGAANVDAHAGIAVPGEIGMVQRIALRSAVALAIRQIFQDGRDRFRFRVLRQPDHGGQGHPVGKRNECVLDHADLV